MGQALRVHEVKCDSAYLGLRILLCTVLCDVRRNIMKLRARIAVQQLFL